MLQVCGLTTTLYYLEIPYLISIIGDSKFKIILKNLFFCLLEFIVFYIYLICHFLYLLCFEYSRDKDISCNNANHFCAKYLAATGNFL